MDNYDAIANNYNEFEQNAITLWRLGYPVVTDLLGDITGNLFWTMVAAQGLSAGFCSLKEHL